MTEIRRKLAPGDVVPGYCRQADVPPLCNCRQHSVDCARMRDRIGGGGRVQLTIPEDGCAVHVGLPRSQRDLIEDYCADRDPLPEVDELVEALGVTERWSKETLRRIGVIRKARART